MTLVVAAMEIELKPFIDKLIVSSYETKIFNNPIFVGELSSSLETILAAVVGIGKVNSAIAVQKLIDTYHPNKVIMIGTAGANNRSYEIGDIIAGESYIQYDIDCSPYLNIDTNGIFPGEERFVKSDGLPNGLKHGVIGSADIFMIPEKINKVNSFIDLVDMETAAVAITCKKNNVKFVSLRVVSDFIYKESVFDLKKIETELAPKLADWAARII
jgi:adenosylhomocysteine nucleosidase